MSDSKSKDLKAIYLLHGEEHFLLNRKFQQIEQEALDPEFVEFNKFVFYGIEVDATQMLDQATTYPMMGGRQLIVLKNAHQFKKWDKLLPYIKNPVDFCTLIIHHPEKKIDGRTAFYKGIKALEKKGRAVIYEAKKLYDNKIPDWIQKEVREKGYFISPKTATLLSEYMGNNLEGIVKELDKIALNLDEGQSEITEAHINKYVGISRKFSVFELQKAMAFGKKEKASNIAYYMSQDPKTNPIYMITGALFTFFSRIYKVSGMKRRSEEEVAKVLKLGHSFFAKEYLSAVRFFPREKCEEAISLIYQYDLKSKGIDSPVEKEDRLLRALVAEILDLIR